MKKIKIFLASSITDLRFDRLEVGDFIRQLNDIYFDRGVQFSLIKCDDYDNAIAADGKQSEFDREIRDSELCFFLFFKKVGDYTRHEFEVALEAFRNNKKPKIVTYFKYVETPDEAQGEVRAFMQMLDGEVKHYYNIYQNIDTLKLGILMQVKLMGLDAEEPKVEGGKVVFGGQTVAETSALPVFAGNASLAGLKEKYKALTQRYYELREKLSSDLDDEAAEEEYRKAAGERAETEKKIREAEKRVLEAMKSMLEKTAEGDLSPRQIAAYRAFENGNYQSALEILDLNEIMSDLVHGEEMFHANRVGVQTHVNELLQRIKVLTARGVDGETAAEIKQIYATVAQSIQECGLKQEPLFKYAEFLYRQNDFMPAIKVAEQLKYYYSDPENPAREEEKAKLCNLLGILYSETNDRDKGEAAFAEALEIYRRLAAQGSAAFEADIAMCYNNFGTLYYDMQRYEEGEEAMKRAVEMYGRLAQHSAAFEPDLATCYDNLGALYSDMQCYEKAEEAYSKAIGIRARLAKQKPAQYECDLAVSHNNFGTLYFETQRYDEAERAYTGAIAIRERLAKQNPDAFEHDLAVSYHNFGDLSYQMQRYEAAGKAYADAAKIYERSAKRSPVGSEPMLAMEYFCLGNVYEETGDERAEEYLNKAYALAVKYPRNATCANLIAAFKRRS